MDVGKDKLLEMYRSMQRIRQFETKTRDLALANETAGFRPRFDRRGGARHRGVRGAAQNRPHHLDPSRPRPSARQGRPARPDDGRAVWQEDRLLQGQGRLDAHRRLRARHPRRQRHRRRRLADCDRLGAGRGNRGKATTSPHASLATALPTRAPSTNRSISRRCGNYRWSSSARITATASSPRCRP